jgi:YebC/PmpR family DNA-binding regulatory protein
MSGHSKWKTIKRQKGATDAKRGQLFTKLSMAITLAVRQGGGVADLNSNPRLRLAIDTARSANMPKENIDRAIQRAAGKQASEMEEVVYEGFGPGGFSMIIEAITDNKNRTTPEIKSKVEKLGGRLGVQGSVSYQFAQKGLISIEKNGQMLDDLFLMSADAGAEDVEDEGEEVLVYTKIEEVGKIRDILAQKGLIVKNAEFTRIPLTFVQITDKESGDKAITFIDKLEEMDDIQKIYANFDIPEEIEEQIV